ncbi:MAG: hypothetical protein H0T75_16800 [Rhizobiales bacterium]|nr:hypothetical protein [Hyphomicrobiales bacterium]
MARKPLTEDDDEDQRTPEGRRRSQPAGSTYEVGYGKPPPHTRFKPGQSGNPKGRPKRHRNLRTVVEEALAETITIREGDRTRTVPRLEALVRTIMNRALKGDPKFVASLIALIRTVDLVGDEPEPDTDAPATREEEKLVADFVRRHGGSLPELMRLDGLLPLGSAPTAGPGLRNNDGEEGA